MKSMNSVYFAKKQIDSSISLEKFQAMVEQAAGYENLTVITSIQERVEMKCSHDRFAFDDGCFYWKSDS